MRSPAARATPCQLARLDPAGADKGDGTPASKAERKGYYAHDNKGHIPDLIRFGSSATCWEFKCYTPFLPSGAKGNGSARCGGAASRADGHFIALGNTEV